MITRSPFGFISYNSRKFLKSVLETFIDEGKFFRCACWYHESTGEEKNHFHCWVEPAVQIDTATIVDRFVEIDEETNTTQSIAILPHCSSKWNDAYLYGIHNSDYLVSKGLFRENVNIVSDMHIYLGDFKTDIAKAEYYLLKSCMAPYARLKRLVYDGFTLEQVYITLRIPFGQLNAVAKAYGNISYQLGKERLEVATEETAKRAQEIENRRNTAFNELPIEDIANLEEIEDEEED